MTTSRAAGHAGLTRRTTDRPIAPAVIAEVLREQVERPRAAAVLLRFGYGSIAVQRVVAVIIQLRQHVSAAPKLRGQLTILKSGRCGRSSSNYSRCRRRIRANGPAVGQFAGWGQKRMRRVFREGKGLLLGYLNCNAPHVQGL